MMLSTVNIMAAGETGEENVNLLVDGQVVQSWESVSSQGETLTWNTDATLTADQVRIEFTNDLYLPEQGFDRNLVVTELQIDNRSFRTDDPSVFSTGTWKPEDGVTPGFRQSDTLHTDGYFQYAEVTGPRTIDFDNATWEIKGDSAVSVDPGSGVLTLSGASGPVSVAREVNVVGGELFDFNIDAWREIIAGEFASDNQPWASAGVNFYDVSGRQIGQQQIDLNTPRNAGDDGFRSVERVAPGNADRAFLWIWINDFESGDNIPLNVRDVNYSQVDLSNDTSPPTVELVPFTYTDNGRSEINFAIDFTDDRRLGSTSIDAITITGPNGFEGMALPRTGQPGNTDSFQRVIYGLVAPDGLWDQSDNGIYTVTLNPNTVSDQAGNFTDGGILGTFAVDVTPLPVDTTPPQVVLFSVPDVVEPPTGGRGDDIQFVVEYTDNQNLGDTFGDRILVTGPNGYQGFGVGIAGGPADPSGFFEITYIPKPSDGVWDSNDNGIYTVTLLDNKVFDESGNVAAGGELGSFLVNLPDEFEV